MHVGFPRESMQRRKTKKLGHDVQNVKVQQVRGILPLCLILDGTRLLIRPLIAHTLLMPVLCSSCDESFIKVDTGTLSCLGHKAFELNAAKVYLSGFNKIK